MKKKLLLIQNLATLLLAIFVATSSYGQNALHFDGIDDFVVTSYNGLSGNNSRTIEAWVKADYKTGQAVIADMGGMTAGQRFTFNLLNGKLRIEVGGAGQTGSITVADGNWHHVAVTYDNSLSTGQFNLYVDGVADGAAFDLSRAVATASGSFRMGARMDSVNNFAGKMDEVRLWNTARSLAQIVADTGSEFCSNQAGLVAYHKFNHGIPNATNTNDSVSTDASTLANDGELVGFALSGTSSNWTTGKVASCTPASCLKPVNPGSTNVLGTSADVYWTQSNSGSTFRIEYGPTGFTIGQGISITSTNDTISLSGLSTQTSYDVYIKEICSATDSSTWSFTSFTTDCAVISTFPYLETFDNTPWAPGTGAGNTGDVIDDCWSVSPSASSTYKWGTRSEATATSATGPTTDFSGTGNYIFTESSYGSNGSKANFQSVTFDLSSLTSPLLTFQQHMYGAYVGSLSLWAWNGSSYDTVWTLAGDQGNLWNEVTVDLNAYKANPTHLVFHATRGATYTGDIAIDNIAIDEAPPCPKPTSVYLDSITAHSVNINFTSTGNYFMVEYGPTGFVQGTGTTIGVSASGQTITGLNADSIYDFYIYNDCSSSSNGISGWAGPYTIRTLCSFSNAYYTNWDNLSSNESDFCWTFLQYGSTYGYAYAYSPTSSAALQPMSGSNYYRFNNSSATKAYLVSPEITALPQNTLQVRFQGSDTYNGTVGSPAFIVGTMASPSDTGSFVAIDTVETISNIWTEFTVVLDNVPADHRHVVLRHAINATTVVMAIDDLNIEAIPACVPPSAGVFSLVQDTSLVFDWIGGDGNTFEIEYGAAGFTQGSGSIISNINDTNLVLNGLSPQTCYDFYIRGNCTSNNSPWYGPVSICTECSIFTAPYSEGFEDSTWVAAYTLSPINTCWSRSSASTYNWLTTSGSTQSGNTGPLNGATGSGKYVYTESSNGALDDWAILETPTIDFSNLTNPSLSFSYHMHGSTIGSLHIRIFNGTSYDTLHTIIGAQQQSAGDPWKVAYVDLTGYQSTPQTIQFVGQRGSSYTGDMAIDEILIDEMPTCIIPDNFVLDSVYANFADFSWNSVTNGSAFKLQYGPAGFNQASNTGANVYTSGSPSRVSGLSANTTYDIYLADMCDSTNWVGPITFTTLINDDAELQNLISPSNLVCGDSSQVVEVTVKNNGLNTITTLNVGANISGAFTANISNTYSGSIAPGTSANITVGTINSFAGGVINLEVYTSLVGDQQVSNDTLTVSGIEIISGRPALYALDTLCVNDSIGQFAAVAQTGIIYNWYQNATDSTPFATGDTVDVLPNQTLFVDRSKQADQLINDGSSSSQFGNMFKIYVQNDFLFTGFSFEPASTGAAEPIAFFKQGNFEGFETDRSAWTAIDSLAMSSVIADTWQRFDFSTPVQLTAGDTISIYLANKLGTKIRWSNLSSVTNVGDLLLTNSDFEYYAGVTGAYFGNNMTTGNPRAVSSIIHYSTTDVCGNHRLAVTMPVSNDTAMASFTHTVSNGVDVDFDASASTGHVYNWNFGDGNNGSGENTNHTYSTSGAYKVTLTVTDTVCGTTDTISQTINITIGLSEYALDGRVAVYPNPNNGNFKVDLNLNGADDVQLVLVNTIGQIMYNQYLGQVGTNTTTELNIENLTPGIYHLHVMASGKSTTVKITVL